jgi:hypothetical protein
MAKLKQGKKFNLDTWWLKTRGFSVNDSVHNTRGYWEELAIHFVGKSSEERTR